MCPAFLIVANHAGIEGHIKRKWWERNRKDCLAASEGMGIVMRREDADVELKV